MRSAADCPAIGLDFLTLLADLMFVLVRNARSIVMDRHGGLRLEVVAIIVADRDCPSIVPELDEPGVLPAAGVAVALRVQRRAVVAAGFRNAAMLPIARDAKRANCP